MGTDFKNAKALPPVCLPEILLPAVRRAEPRQRRGFTVVELMIVMLIILTVFAMVIPSIARAMETNKVTRAVADIQNLQMQIEHYNSMNGAFPNTLADLGPDVPLLDPWGRPYRYLNFAGATGKGDFRKDRFLVPLNSTFDLYSMGADGESQPPLNAKASRDDIVRANDGGFVGLASSF